jgi:hypothetical protein
LDVCQKISKFTRCNCLKNFNFGVSKNYIETCLQNIRRFIKIFSNWYISIWDLSFFPLVLFALTNSSLSSRVKWPKTSSTIGCWTKLVLMFRKNVDIQNIIAILSCCTSLLCHLIEIKIIFIHNTTMK